MAITRRGRWKWRKIIPKFSAGDQQSAYEHAAKAREAFPDNPDVARTFRTVAYQHGELAAAARALKDAPRQPSSAAALFFHREMVHSRLKEATEGKQALGRARELHPNASFAAEARKVLDDLN